MWKISYQERLLDWIQLRQACVDYTPEQTLSAVNNWWWRAPIVNRAIEWHDFPDWPDPWHLLNSDGYCELAKALGITYTLMMLDNFEYSTLEIVQVENDNLVLLDHGKYILNSAPGEILNINSYPLAIIRSIDSSKLTHFLS